MSRGMESFEDEKVRLQIQAKMHLDAIESRFRGTVPQVKKTASKAVAIGGALFLIYIAGRKVFKKKKTNLNRDPFQQQLVIKTPKKESFIARKIKEQISIFLLSMVRERLSAYIRESSRANEPVQSTKGQKR
jgi:hypothetical protein